MTISNNYVPVKVQGDGTTMSFSADWPIFNPAWLDVYLEDIATGVQTLQVLGTNYSITSYTSAGVVIDFTIGGVAPPNTDDVILSRNVPLQQTTPYSTSVGFQGKQEETSFDILTAISQQLQEQLTRALLLPLGSSVTDLTLPNPSPGLALIWDPTGQFLINSTYDPDSQQAAAAASATAAAASASTASSAATAAASSATAASTSATSAAASAAAAAGYVVPSQTGKGGLVLQTNGSAVSWGNGLAGFRNKIINGDFRVDQRHGFNSVTLNTSSFSIYTMDRWIASYDGVASTGPTFQPTGPSGNEPTVYQITGAPSNTVTTLTQRIEAENTQDLYNQNATLSALMIGSTGKTVTWQIVSPTVRDNWASAAVIASGTFSVTSSAQIFSASFNAGSYALNGLGVVFSLANFTSGTLSIGEVQLEAGSIMTPFERRPFGVELALAQRFYQKSYSQNVLPGTTYTAGNGAITWGCQYSGVNDFTVRFPVIMRTNPTLTCYDALGNAGYISYNNGSWNSALPQEVIYTGDGGFTMYTGAACFYGNCEYTAIAEL